MVQVLRAHRRAMLSRPASAGVGNVGDRLVFCGPDGAPHHPERVYQAFRRAVICHHLPPIPLHGLRHTWATLAQLMGVHPRRSGTPRTFEHRNHVADLFTRVADHARRRRSNRRRTVHARVLDVSTGCDRATRLDLAVAAMAIGGSAASGNLLSCRTRRGVEAIPWARRGCPCRVRWVPDEGGGGGEPDD